MYLGRSNAAVWHLTWVRVIAFLLPLALMMTVLSTGLFLAGLVTPFWFHVHHLDGNKTALSHYGIFTICQRCHGCNSWEKYRRIHASPRQRLDYFSPVGTGASEVFLSMNFIALVESDIILLWLVFKSPTLFWAKSALACTSSGLLYGVTGTAVFVIVRTNNEAAKLTVGWSAIVVIVSVILEALVALCIQLALTWKVVKPSDSNTTLSATYSESTTTKPEALSQWDKLMANDKMVAHLPVSRDKKAPAKQTGPELLRLVQMQRQQDRPRTKRSGGAFPRKMPSLTSFPDNRPSLQTSVKPAAQTAPATAAVDSVTPTSSEQFTPEPDAQNTPTAGSVCSERDATAEVEHILEMLSEELGYSATNLQNLPGADSPSVNTTDTKEDTTVDITAEPVREKPADEGNGQQQLSQGNGQQQLTQSAPHAPEQVILNDSQF